MTSKDHLYFVQCSVTGLVKIGRTVRIRRRLTELQNGSPTDLNVYAVIRNMGHLEQDIHKRFRHLNTRGEWFCFTKDLHTYVDELLHRYEIQDKYQIGDV